MKELSYEKKWHFWDSPSVFLDIDSLIYLDVSVVLIWSIVCADKNRMKKESIKFSDFVSSYTILCSVPVVCIFLVQLMMSGIFILSNWIVAFLPLIYSIIIQVILMIIKKWKK